MKQVNTCDTAVQPLFFFFLLSAEKYPAHFSHTLAGAGENSPPATPLFLFFLPQNYCILASESESHLQSVPTHPTHRRTLYTAPSHHSIQHTFTSFPPT